MPAYKDLGEILRRAVGLEKKLKDFYDVAELAVRSPESRAAITALKSRLVEKLSVLEGVNPEKFGTLEWVKYPPEIHDDEVIPKRRITRDSSPAEVYSQILASEEKLRGYYMKVSEQLVARAQKDLFDSLVAFKTEQMEEIRRLVGAQSA